MEKRILDALFGQIEIAGDPEGRSENRGPLPAMRVRDGLFDRCHRNVCYSIAPEEMGRTSTPPPCQLIGHRLAIARAWSRSRASST